MKTAPNDRAELARLLPELVDRDLPSDRQFQIREFVMSHITQQPAAVEPGRRRVARRRLFAATATLAAVAVAGVALGPGGVGGLSSRLGPGESPGDPPVEVSPVSRTFELAAAHAATQPFTAPGPDQWIYVRNRNTFPGAIAESKGQRPVQDDAVWLRADGTRMAAVNRETDRLDVWRQDNDYPRLSTLPTDPRELLAVLRAELAATPEWPADGPRPPRPERTADQDDLLFSRITGILHQHLLPPAVTAALWRAAALVDGVRQEAGTQEVAGRTVVAVGRVQEGWRFEQLLVDADTHEFVGIRSKAVRDFTVDSPAGPVTTKKGEVQFTITRVAARVVDRPGQRR
jgi:hypothetical protein